MANTDRRKAVGLEEDRGVDINFWILPYGNMITIVMIFFLILYAYSYIISQKQYESTLVKIQEDLGRKMSEEELEQILMRQKELEKQRELEKLFKEAGLEEFATITEDEQRVRIVMKEPVLFDLGKAELKSGAHYALGKIASVLKVLPNEIAVEGYTDNVPIIGGEYRTNWELSTARAFNVIRYLVHYCGLNPRNLAGVGYGEYHPLYPNDTKEYRAANRRVEIVVIKSAGAS